MGTPETVAPEVAGPPLFLGETEWKHLLRAVYTHNVIPIVGPGLVTVPDADGRVITLTQWLVPRLAAKLGVGLYLNRDWKEPGGSCCRGIVGDNSEGDHPVYLPSSPLISAQRAWSNICAPRRVSAYAASSPSSSPPVGPQLTPPAPSIYDGLRGILCRS